MLGNSGERCSIDFFVDLISELYGQRPLTPKVIFEGDYNIDFQILANINPLQNQCLINVFSLIFIIME